MATRRHLSHWEGDTLLGASQSGACLLSLVERESGFVALGKPRNRSAIEVNRRARRLIAAQPHPVRTLTVHNGTEFHVYAALTPSVCTSNLISGRARPSVGW